MAKLRVRVYNVGFGDAILVSVPDRGSNGQVKTRHILIDFGNVTAGPGGDNALFDRVVTDVLKETNNKPLDLYIMTHEHLDHVQGPLYSALKLGKKLKARYAWLTASAARDYYDKHPEARDKAEEAAHTFAEIRHFCIEAFGIQGLVGDRARIDTDERGDAQEEERLAGSGGMDERRRTAHALATLLLNNNLTADGSALAAFKEPFEPTRSDWTAHCVEYLRTIAPENKTTYVYRGIDLKGRHPFKNVSFDIWAPEEDTSSYYGRFQPMSLGIALAGTTESGDSAPAGQPLPPPGVDAGAFYSLVAMRRRGYADNLLSIDAANNNTSVVFCMEWRGWKLLFPGDAEMRSWRTMHSVKKEDTEERGVLEPVHFLKIGHHGSSNATPMDEMLEKILPEEHPDDRKRIAVVSTHLDPFESVPSEKVLRELLSRCDEVHSPVDISAKLDEPFLNVPDRDWVDVLFEG